MNRKTFLFESQFDNDSLNYETELFLTEGISTHLGQEYSELSTFLGCLNAVSMLHQTHHWQTQGKNYYENHLLFQRLYEETNKDIDGFAERIVGLGNKSFVDYLPQLVYMGRFLKLIREQVKTSVNKDVERSLYAELFLIKLGEQIMDSFEEKGLLTRGLEQLIGTILDKHESLVYLLKQKME